MPHKLGGSVLEKKNNLRGLDLLAGHKLVKSLGDKRKEFVKPSYHPTQARRHSKIDKPPWMVAHNKNY
jgi:hypothetical protein